MRNLLFLITALVLSACNLTAPGSIIETPSPAGVQLNQTTSGISTPAAAQTDWLTYTNTQNGYSLQRPSSVSLVEERNGDAVYIDDQIEIVVSDVNPEAARGDGVPMITEATDIMVGQYPGRRIRGSIGSVGGATPQNIEQVIIPHNNRFYVFSVYELKRSGWNGDGRRNLGPIPTTEVELFNSILTTLRFDS